MGIPKFYRWTSERYPCLYEKVREYQIPEFDNLYLDMNGIIHNCSHPNDEDIHLRIPEENIFRDIFHYIDFLFRMIKPCKVFFMAVDGVAPRAKMNQQRGRRFRSARVAEEQEAEAIRQGEKLPSEERFDSNCITPGTEFMARLHEQLKYFVAIKVSTDPLWQRKGLSIYLSGHDVPGEGEHKIMDFIRHIRSLPDYNPETRHCLYGLDADLMMLGLSTHELRFSLLREEVKFSKPKKRKNGKQPQQKKKKPKPKEDGPTPQYDLTNVSIFTNDSTPTDSILKPPTKIKLSAAAAVSTQKSFVDVANTVPLVVPTVPPTTSKGEDQDVPPPPPSDDLTAKGDYKAPLPEKTTFFLLHLSLFRDYLDEEFNELRENLSNHPQIKYELECVIDDWILMNILVGNDFVPHLPNLHIVKGALPMLYRTYMDVLPTLDGYLNESGTLNLKRFETFITRLSQFDLDQFKETYDDMKYKAAKTGKNIVLGEKMFEDFIFEDDTPFKEEEIEPISDELRELAQRTEDEIFGTASSADGTGLVCKEVFPEDDEFFAVDDTEEFRLEFLQHKRNYYLTKCEFKKVDRPAVHDFAKEYVRAIQWVLWYYYRGVCSWGWFYPSHYAPFSSDLRRFGDFQIEFPKGQPFKPFEQLLAVLPSQSRKLLPSCYQWLMTEEDSPILEYYPKKFEQDLNGKRQDWEAVVLIPFIDESKLLNSMKEQGKKLTEEEDFRNSRGSLLCHSYTADNTGPIKSHRNIFPELEMSHVEIEKIFEVNYDPILLPKGLHPKADVARIYQGFPSLKSKTFESTVCKAEVKVFEFYAREESLILSFEKIDEDFDGMKLAKKVLGQQVWVNWPHLEAALVTSVCTRYEKYILGRDKIIIKDPKVSEDAARKTFEAMSQGLLERHLKFRGIKLGTLGCILTARLLEGRKLRCNNVGKVVIENQWSKIEQPFALRTAIFEEKVTEMFYLDIDNARTYLDLFRKDDQVFYLGDKVFGAMGAVVGHDKGNGSVVVELRYPDENDESNLKLKTGLSQLKSQDFFPPYVAATKCGISSFALSRLTGRVLVSVEKVKKPTKKVPRKKADMEGENGSVSDSSESSVEDFPALEPEIQKLNIGLDLKFNKTNMEVRGYTSKRDGQWYYSANTVKLVNEFASCFPSVVELLGRTDKNKDVYSASEIFPEDPYGKTMEIVQWLEDRGVRSLPRIPTNCNVLDDEDIDIVWQYVTKQSAEAKQSGRTWAVRPNLLYKPGLDKGCIAPIPNAQFALLDRVICVDRGAAIPLGVRGTVVGIQAPPKSGNDDNDEAFKSVSADALNLLIIMCDPIADIFDTPNETVRKQTGNGDLNQLTGSLAKLLGVNGVQLTTASEKKTDPRPVQIQQYTRPKLIKLFPYQVINLTQGARNLRQDLKKMPIAAQSTDKAKNSLHNGTVIAQKSYAQSVAGSGQTGKPVKVLQRPNNVAQEKTVSPKLPSLMELVPNKNAAPKSEKQPKLTLPWPPQPMNRSITVDQLFAHAAQQAQTQRSADKMDLGDENIMKVAPVQVLNKNGTGVTQYPSTAGKPNDEKKVKLEKAKVQKRQPAFADQINQLSNSSTTNVASKTETSSATRVFVNSALQKKSAKKSAKERNQNDFKDAKKPLEPAKMDQSQPNNQLLNLLCQPKNLQRMNSISTDGASSNPASNACVATTTSTTNNRAINGEDQITQQQIQGEQLTSVPVQFHHPIHVPYMYHSVHGAPVQFVTQHNMTFVSEIGPSPQGYYPSVWNVPSMNNSGVPTFIQPFPNHGMPAVYPGPPPPPQHWTQHQHGSFSNVPVPNENNEHGRQIRSTNTSNAFVPLQVSRSMARNDVEYDHRRKAPVLDEQTNDQLQQEPVSSKTVVVEDTTIPASQSLKALLGMDTSTTKTQQSDAVPEPRKSSRLAANFGVGRPS